MNDAAVSTGSLSDLQSSIDIVSDRIDSLARTVSSLAEDLNISLTLIYPEPPVLETAATPVPTPRSFIEEACRRVHFLQNRIEEQNTRVEQIRNTLS